MKFISQKTFSRFSVIAFATFCFVGLNQNAWAQERSVDKEIQTFVVREAKKEGGNSYVSKIVRGDINKDGRQDAVVNYAIEGMGGGGNNALLYVAVFLSDGKKLVYKTQISAGASGTASGSQVSASSISNGKIICEVATFAPDDGACCPSIKSQRSYALIGNRLQKSKK
ncbi:MAG: hypothetical protein H7Z37_04090 [Pyrinomonadaceae bacterium]|nr:hypothetical protein [Pyrinomonadaceae bacterium]